jgi:hypothetical protein
MATAQFALLAREQDIALGARFAVEMVRYQALSSHGGRPDCRSCLDVVLSRFIELAGGWFSTGRHYITSKDSAYQLPIRSTLGRLRVLRVTINSKTWVNGTIGSA